MAAFASPQTGIPSGAGTTHASNTQVDNGGIDVRLTQLRNLLAGTRPQTNPQAITVAAATANGDTNFVQSNGASLFMPNGIADLGIETAINAGGSDQGAFSDANNNLNVVRTTPPVPGRWGEAQSIPGIPFANPYFTAGGTGIHSYQNVNTVTINYQNPVRAGYSEDFGDVLNGVSRDAADDNYNSFDPYPAYDATTGTQRTGEVGDLDAYDATGSLLLPVERMRRWLTPADINGTGSVGTWNPAATAPHRGPDATGRVEFTSYFRPPGSPGVISTNYTGVAASGVPPTSTDGTTLGAIYFPSLSPPTPDPFYSSGPANGPPYISTALVPAAGHLPYLPDMTNNPFHGFEAFRFPNQAYHAAAVGPPVLTNFFPQQLGGSPVGGITIPAGTNYDANHIPILYPTYDSTVNSIVHSDGVNEADEMNLYQPYPLLDSPFGPSDLEWLYRQQDVDGASLTSRLSQLAPVSFTNPIDSARRRKLFSTDTWDMTNFVWTNDNPQGAFPTNSRFNPTASVGFLNLNVAASANTTMGTLPLNPTAAFPAMTPTLAQRDKKINLNFPLPVSNDPNEPIRQKWISDTYQLLKTILPPKAVDTPEELAQLSQFVINIVDFRDPDGTMTHWVNPDVKIAGVLAPQDYTTPVVPAAGVTTTTPVPFTSVTLQPANYTTPVANQNPPPPPAIPLPTTNFALQTIPLDQYGMEYNPVALNEVLAYSYLYLNATPTLSRANRFFVELVNTLTSPELAATPASTFNPLLSLGGFSHIAPSATFTMGDPYMSGSWDIVFTADDPYSRPDPYRGQLLPYANTFGLTPLTQEAFGSTVPVALTPLGQAGTIPTPLPSGSPLPGGGISPVAINYFYAFGNAPPSAANEQGAPSTTVELDVHAGRDWHSLVDERHNASHPDPGAVARDRPV